MATFVGRHRELDQLDHALRRARGGEGSFVWVTGRRRVGKSRLVQEFLQQSDVRYVFFQAPQRSGAVAEFVAEIGHSNTHAGEMVRDGMDADNWRAALRLAASGATTDQPVVIVIDEYPYLHERDDGVDADVQAVWDASLESLPIVLICIGSDLAMMERLLQHDRPLHGRPTAQMRVDTLDPFEIAELLQLDPVDALDAYLVVGGYPAVARDWKPGASMSSFLKSALAHGSSPLVINGERILAAEFAAELNARRVLEAIGLGERTYTAIGSAAAVGGPTLPRALGHLADKQLVEQRRPLAVPPGTKDTRYQIVDAGLRFWLKFVGPFAAELDRGRGDLVVDRILREWNDFRGRSIEPVIREALTRIVPDARFGATEHVGSYWTRSNHPEVDLIGVDRFPKPRTVTLTGSIKWRDQAPFDDNDAKSLIGDTAFVPGTDADTLLIGVSRTGFDTDRLDIQVGPELIVNAYRPRS